SADLFDPSTLKWDSVTAPLGRINHTATLLLNNKVLLVGGFTVTSSSGGGTVSVKEVELYDPVRGVSVPFNLTAPIGKERDGHTATLLTNGKVLVIGGQTQTRDSLSFTDTVELFDVGLSALDTSAPA